MRVNDQGVAYGSAPHVVGTFDVAPCELMFVQYMPVFMHTIDTTVRTPSHVACFRQLIAAAIDDAGGPRGRYVYLSTRHLYVTPDNTGNRPGWHADGFGTDDINYIWSDSAPTEFCVQPFDLNRDCDVSMREMEEQARAANVQVYGDRTLLRLDSSVIHRTPMGAAPGFRRFVKISISTDRYNLEGNAHNPLFNYRWDMQPRATTRNHPSGDSGDAFASRQVESGQPQRSQQFAREHETIMSQPTVFSGPNPRLPDPE